MNSWTLTVEEGGMLSLPQDLLDAADWKEGDCLNWIDNNDGTWSLVKEDLTNFIHKGIINNDNN